MSNAKFLRPVYLPDLDIQVQWEDYASEPLPRQAILIFPDGATHEITKEGRSSMAVVKNGPLSTGDEYFVWSGFRYGTLAQVVDAIKVGRNNVEPEQEQAPAAVVAVPRQLTRYLVVKAVINVPATVSHDAQAGFADQTIFAADYRFSYTDDDKKNERFAVTEIVGVLDHAPPGI